MRANLFTQHAATVVLSAHDILEHLGGIERLDGPNDFGLLGADCICIEGDRRLHRRHRHEPDVTPNSTTETYIAWKLNIDNWRWAGVPFYLRTGKSLKRRLTEIAICFHQAPYALFRDTNVERMNPNWLILRIQPDEGIALEFAAKRPGPTVKLSNVRMD